jgi:hypothetical protein
VRGTACGRYCVWLVPSGDGTACGWYRLWMVPAVDGTVNSTKNVLMNPLPPSPLDKQPTRTATWFGACSCFAGTSCCAQCWLRVLQHITHPLSMHPRRHTASHSLPEAPFGLALAVGLLEPRAVLLAGSGNCSHPPLTLTPPTLNPHLTCQKTPHPSQPTYSATLFGACCCSAGAARCAVGRLEVLQPPPPPPGFWYCRHPAFKPHPIPTRTKPTWTATWFRACCCFAGAACCAVGRLRVLQVDLEGAQLAALLLTLALATQHRSV